jgi:hypothetical protein
LCYSRSRAGWIGEAKQNIARESSAWHVNYADPCTGLKRGWFATSILNGTHSGEVEQNLMRKIQAISGFKALSKQ